MLFFHPTTLGSIRMQRSPDDGKFADFPPHQHASVAGGEPLHCPASALVATRSKRLVPAALGGARCCHSWRWFPATMGGVALLRGRAASSRCVFWQASEDQLPAWSKLDSARSRGKACASAPGIRARARPEQPGRGRRERENERGASDERAAAHAPRRYRDDGQLSG